MDAESKFTEVALDTLSKDALFLIFERLTPKSVLKLCQVSNRFAEYCSNDNFWIMMMKKHYPQFQLTNDPRAQYQALANDHTTVYYVEGNFATELDDIATLEYPANLDEEQDIEVWEIKVRGLPLENGTELWTSFIHNRVTEHSGAQEETTLKAYNTLEEAVDDTLDATFEEFLEGLRAKAGMIYGVINNETIDQAAGSINLPVPVTRERWREWLLKNGNILRVDLPFWYLIIGFSMTRFEQ